ncbi:hypothetical protein GcM1_196013 [Golovinomyces cichoracearum]|uniref:Uncharacterized protein n=1 Tax=Golovinomyces cichoracearum TaxID=62708 RepID=A0A420IZY1_9PEZI|nr:hypothetical protein GcM1_196013 [Golovinomyces cichoracearum]
MSGEDTLVMVRAPVAQMNNGQPYVGPPAPETELRSASDMEAESLRDMAADVPTVWTTATVTSVDVQTSIVTSVVISYSTSIIQISATPSMTGTNSNLLGSVTSTDPLNQSAISTKTSDISLSTPMIPLMNSNSTSGSSLYMTNPSASNIFPAASITDPPSVANFPSNEQDLAKVMAGLIVGIFLTAALLSFGLYIFRKREEKHSEIEAANAAERQQQPLMNEPIAPYSSAYGTEPHD